MDATDIKIDKMASSACGCTTSANHTTKNGTFGLIQIVQDRLIISVVIYLAVITDIVTEIFQRVFV